MSESLKIARINSIFVTVGTTEFDELISTIDKNALKFLELICRLGCKHLSIQIGRGTIYPNNLAKLSSLYHIDVTVFKFKSSLSEDMSRADLIISHCGAGTMIESLKLQKLIIVVVNETLQGNHQTELSDELSKEGFCISCVPSQLCDQIEVLSANTSHSFKAYPKPNLDIFPSLLDSMFE